MRAQEVVPSPFAIGPGGEALASGDGPELLVWRGDGSPLWKAFADGILVGICIVGNEVAALDNNGVLYRHRLQDGELIEKRETRAAAFGLRPSGIAAFGIGSPSGITVVASGGGEAHIEVDGLKAFAFDPTGTHAAALTHAGNLELIDRSTAERSATLPLPAPCGALAALPSGGYLVGGDRVIYRVRADATLIDAVIATTGEVRALATSPGVLAAAHVVFEAGEAVEVFELFSPKSVGQLAVRRPLGGVGFGPGFLIAVGLDDGDGNVLDLVSGSATPTEPHQGRARTTWRLENRVDAAAIRGAAAHLTAGGKPIATYVPPKAAGEGGSGGCWGGCAAFVGLVVVLTAFCAGLGLLIWALRAYGLWEYLPIR